MTTASVTPAASYAELHCISHFSFLRGASSPEELVRQAANLGYRALALTDECSVAGVVRAHGEARKQGLQLIIGSEVTLAEGVRLVLLVACREGYTSLCRLLTQGRRAAAKGNYRLGYADLADGLPGCRVLYLPAGIGSAAGDRDHLQRLRRLFGTRLWLAAELFRDGHAAEQAACCRALAEAVDGRVVATGDVHMHVRGRRALQDTVTAIRLGCTVAEAGTALHANGERYLRPITELQQLYPAEWLSASSRLAAELRFSLTELDYRYPCELVPTGLTPSAWLRRLTEQGAAWRWPDGMPDAVRRQIDYELALIGELRYEGYFLTVHDIVRFARPTRHPLPGQGFSGELGRLFLPWYHGSGPCAHQHAVRTIHLERA